MGSFLSGLNITAIDCCFHKCVRVSKRYSRQFSSSLLSEQSSSSSHLHMVGMHLLLLHWNCPSSHSVSVPVSVPENDSEENYSRVLALPFNPRQPATITWKERNISTTAQKHRTEPSKSKHNVLWPAILLLHAHFKEAMTKKTNKSFFLSVLFQTDKKCFFLLGWWCSWNNKSYAATSPTFNILLVLRTSFLIKSYVWVYRQKCGNTRLQCARVESSVVSGIHEITNTASFTPTVKKASDNFMSKQREYNKPFAE